MSRLWWSRQGQLSLKGAAVGSLTATLVAFIALGIPHASAAKLPLRTYAAVCSGALSIAEINGVSSYDVHLTNLERFIYYNPAKQREPPPESPPIGTSCEYSYFDLPEGELRTILEEEGPSSVYAPSLSVSYPERRTEWGRLEAAFRQQAEKYSEQAGGTLFQPIDLGKRFRRAFVYAWSPQPSAAMSATSASIYEVIGLTRTNCYVGLGFPTVSFPAEKKLAIKVGLRVEEQYRAFFAE